MNMVMGWTTVVMMAMLMHVMFVMTLIMKLSVGVMLMARAIDMMTLTMLIVIMWTMTNLI